MYIYPVSICYYCSPKCFPPLAPPKNPPKKISEPPGQPKNSLKNVARLWAGQPTCYQDFATKPDPGREVGDHAAQVNLWAAAIRNDAYPTRWRQPCETIPVNKGFLGTNDWNERPKSEGNECPIIQLATWKAGKIHSDNSYLKTKREYWKSGIAL